MFFISYFQVAIGKLPVLTIYGDQWETKDGTGVRDFIHVVDLAKGHVKALERMDKNGKGMEKGNSCSIFFILNNIIVHVLGSIGTEVFNLGTGTGYSVKEMVTAMENASGRSIPSKVL